jgi:hypothetical protein
MRFKVGAHNLLAHHRSRVVDGEELLVVHQIEEAKGRDASVGATGDLGCYLVLDDLDVARDEFGRQPLAPGGIDALADEHCRAVKRDYSLGTTPAQRNPR